MNKPYKLSLFIFRRDLRLDDNTALNEAQKASARILPCFIFDPRQIDAQNTYRSTNSVQFMLESLKDLASQIKKERGSLHFFYGKAEDVVHELLKSGIIDAVFFNADYTPFSRKRDATLAALCKTNGVPCFAYHDALLHQPDTIKNKQDLPYTVFTPFYKRSLEEPVSRPETLPFSFYTESVKINEKCISSLDEQFSKLTYNPQVIKGGSTHGKEILGAIKELEDYAKTRDFPSIPTSHLSAHFKFGTVSIRDAFYTMAKKLGAGHALVRQLYWRDFYTQIAYHFPRVFGHAFHEKYDSLDWSTNKEYFARWCTGTTGFPIVDAGMRELNATGYMHNRVRMIVASFLTKDLHINWQWGEKYFAQQLVDYDPAVNNGNWQWTASTGCDPQPYFRIFNPWLQQKKFDPECIYIKKWVTELTDTVEQEIHSEKRTRSINGYPPPMLVHGKESELAKSYYKNA